MSNSSVHIRYSTSQPRPQDTMSPVTFKHQVAELAYELNRCILLCKDIRANRKLGSTHENLDRFQDALESAENSIPAAYSTARNLKGIEMEIGDEKARSEMRAHISSVQSVIKPRLKQIAHPPQSRPRSRGQNGYHEREKPGFRDLLRQWNIVYDDICSTVRSLSRRVEASSTGRSSPIPIATYVSPPATHIHVSHISPPQSPRPRAHSPSQHYGKGSKNDDPTISVTEYNYMLSHLKNSWEEIVVGDEVQYVNCYDRSRKQWIRPNDAFIRRCVRQGGRLSRCPSFERRSPAMSGSSFTSTVFD